MRNRATIVLASSVCLLIAVAVALVTWRYYKVGLVPLKRNTSMLDKETATTIVSMDDFASALTHDLLILHLDVDWAMQAIQSRAVIVRFKESLDSDSRFANVTFRRVDCTDQEGAVWDALEELIKPYDRSGTLMVGGNGAVVWVRSGKVVDAVRCAAAEGADKMTAVTHKAMSAQSTEESGAK